MLRADRTKLVRNVDSKKCQSARRSGGDRFAAGRDSHRSSAGTEGATYPDKSFQN
jgi:hypothetical protein